MLCYRQSCDVSLHGRQQGCRWQAGGKQLDSASPRESGSPELEVTAEQLAAGEEEGAASIVEVYAALLLGFVAEGSAHQQKVRVWPCLLPSKTQRWPSMMQISMKPTSFLRTWLPLRRQPPCGTIMSII